LLADVVFWETVVARKSKFGFSWSWKRASGISAAKEKLSRQIGIPLTRSGRQRKIGRVTGCCVPLAIMMGGGIAAFGWLVA
jgi:hypothetical protein